MQKLEEKGIKRNLLSVMLAQVVSMGASVVMAFLVPKVLGIEEYAQWQTFILYTGYCGMAAIGANDGMLLRLGGRRIESVGRGEFGNVFLLFVAIQVAFGAISFAFAISSDDLIARLPLVVAAIYLPIYNITTYLQYFFQATNHAELFARSSNINRAVFLFLLIGLVAFRSSNHVPYVVAYTVSLAVSLTYCIWTLRTLLHREGVAFNSTIKVFRDDVISGMNIMIAFYAGLLILGVGRFAVQSCCSVYEFSYYSFASSLMGFALTFIAQIGVIMFPMLKRADAGRQELVIKEVETGLELLTPALFLIYPILAACVEGWLPDYIVAIRLFAFFFPALLWDVKTNLVYLPLMKARRREKDLISINAGSLLVSVVLVVPVVVVLKNIYLAALFSSIAVVVRSLLLRAKLGEGRDYPLLDRWGIIELVGVFLYSILLFKAPYFMTGIVSLAYFVSYFAIRRDDYKRSILKIIRLS